MTREAKQPSHTSAAPSPRHSKKAAVEVASLGDAALLTVNGMIDEHFGGLGDLSAINTAVIDLSRIKFISSFGVARWLKAMAALPPNVREVYFVGCPRIFVEQLNMILNFGGKGQILTVLAPYSCTKCGKETDEAIDVVAEGMNLANGRLPEKVCLACGAPMQFDEIPETYFACLGKYGPKVVNPVVEQLLSTDTKSLPKQVINSTAPKEAKPKRSGVSIWMILLGIFVIGLAAGMYVLVGPK